MVFFYQRDCLSQHSYFKVITQHAVLADRDEEDIEWILERVDVGLRLLMADDGCRGCGYVLTLHILNVV